MSSFQRGWSGGLEIGQPGSREAAVELCRPFPAAHGDGECELRRPHRSRLFRPGHPRILRMPTDHQEPTRVRMDTRKLMLAVAVLVPYTLVPAPNGENRMVAALDQAAQLTSQMPGGVRVVELPQRAAEPLEVARWMAAKYPASPIMSYIPALAWSGSLRLAELTGEARWREKPHAEMQPFITGEKQPIAEPYLLTSLAGHLAFSDAGAWESNAAAAEVAKKGADFILGQSANEIVRFPRNWTDDMFMATSVLARVGERTGDPKYGQAVGRLLTSYAAKLQRPDGLFIHAEEGPHAWGRGNGFAMLGFAEALAHLPQSWPDRAAVLEIYRKHMRAMVRFQSEDGSWRQVVDEPTAYHELTVTAMTVATMARGVRLGWIDRAEFMPVIQRGWEAVSARASADGTVKDVCSGTGAMPTKDYYMQRPVVNGMDDRGGAMVLLAAIEMEELARAR
jgi:rhamnogalacturonyl hydrolase YesR